MSRSRSSLTPFDDVTDRDLANKILMSFNQREQRQKKDLEKLDQVYKEICDGYKGRVNVSNERDAELMTIMARIFENRSRLGMASKRDREIFEVYRSHVSAPSNDATSNPCEQGRAAKRSMNRRAPAATRRSTHTTRQRRPRGRNPAAAGIARRESERRAPLYTDIMPENGLRQLSAVDITELGARLLQQMDKINKIRERSISLNHCRSRFSSRVPFLYNNKYYIFMCQVHPDEDLDSKTVARHYRDKHCVADKRLLRKEAIKYLGTEITSETPSEKSEIERYIEDVRMMSQQPSTMPVIPEEEEPRRIVTLDTSAIRAALAATQPEIQTANGTRANDITATAAQENEVSGADVTPSAEMANAGAMSPLTEVPTRNVSREPAAGPESWNWTPTWLAAIREATPEQPETNNVPGSIRNPLMVLDNEESGGSRGVVTAAASTVRDPGTPSPVRVKMQGSPGSRLRRLGVRGVQLSPELFRSRTPAGADPWNAAQESNTQVAEAEQQQQFATGESAGIQQPSLSQYAPTHAGNDEVGAMGAVEELMNIVEQSFTPHRFVLGV